jgi:Na+-translocating ferredoxin:NAD+ oxidoreductase RnfG subunit
MSSSSIIFRAVVSLLLLFSFSVELLADVCVWRDPEKTMVLIFPQARDYKTLDRKISNENRAAIEKRIGKPLDPGERESWSHYEIVGDDGKPLGYVIADAEKGEYGVIEIVMGITADGKVKQVYIQRARERKKEFKSKEFLNQFVGKMKDEPIQIGKDIKAEHSLSNEQVAFAVKKMLVMFDELH